MCLDVAGRNVVVFGRGDYGQLGVADDPKWGYSEAEPVRLDALEIERTNLVTHIACGDHSSFAVKQDGSVYSWGFGEGGALGHRRLEEDQRRPKIITTVKAAQLMDIGKVKHVSSGAQHSAIIM